jgi:hypothetical protein
MRTLTTSALVVMRILRLRGIQGHALHVPSLGGLLLPLRSRLQRRAAEV